MPSTTPSTGITTDDQTHAVARRAAGEFVRGVSTARHWVTTTNSSSSNAETMSSYPVQAGRYHLYVAYNCPWCHRVLVGHAIMGLHNAISVDVLFPNRSTEEDPRGPNLWKFAPDGQGTRNGATHVQFPSCTADTVLGKAYVKDIYEASGIMDQKSVPILFDKETKTVVNNESSEILRMFGTVFQPLSTCKNGVTTLYPAEKREEIDSINDWIYTDVANGAYKAGFSSSQIVYEKAYHTFFAALDRLEQRLANNRFLVGDNVTEADVRLFPVLFRFDPVYYTRFKLSKQMLWEYPHLWRWMGDMMRLEGMGHVSGKEYLAHCKQGYFGRTGNGTVPVGPPGYPECYLSKHPLQK